jgi:nucleotide-binding universal stress UspA family protein
MLRWFPNRTETDLYLWVSEHLDTLKQELEWDLTPGEAAIHLAKKDNPRVAQMASVPGHWRQSKLYDRYMDRLFQDILVPVGDDTSGFLALEQSILIAQKEQASLRGLHVLPSRGNVDLSKAEDIKELFDRRCQDSGASGKLAIVRGDVTGQIISHALMTDLLVLHVAFPPEPGLTGTTSGLRSIISRSARPVLAVQGNISPLDRALLAFDGSAKAREALFVAAYVAEAWNTHLTVMTLSGNGNDSASVQEYARSYLELHEIEADYVVKIGSMDTFLDVSKERDINLILMGGYSGNVLKGFVIGSLVDHLIRKFEYPILICR